MVMVVGKTVEKTARVFGGSLFEIFEEPPLDSFSILKVSSVTSRANDDFS